MTTLERQQLIEALIRGGYNLTDATNAANGSNAGVLYKEYCQTFEKKVLNFFNQWNGRSDCNFDGVFGNQCVDLWKFFNRDVVGGPAVSGNAIDYWEKYPKKFYTRIVNTITAIPKRGDVAIFDRSKVLPLGHIAIVDSANLFTVRLFEVNWPVQGYYDKSGNFIGTGKCYFRTHNYLSPKIKGWLHPIK